MKVLSCLVGLGLVGSAAAGDRGEHVSFPSLKSFEIESDSIYLWYEPSASKLLIDEFPTRIPDLEARIPILETKIGEGEGAGAGAVCRIEFSWGPSEDPHFILNRNVNGEWLEMGIIHCDELTIPSNGSIYAWGWSNQMFAKSRKFGIANGKVAEVAQPFYNVDMHTKTKTPITDRNFLFGPPAPEARSDWG